LDILDHSTPSPGISGLYAEENFYGKPHLVNNATQKWRNDWNLNTFQNAVGFKKYSFEKQRDFQQRNLILTWVKRGFSLNAQ
jgi:hypothetical protein